MNIYEQIEEESKQAKDHIILEGEDDENDGADVSGKPDGAAEGEEVEAEGGESGKDAESGSEGGNEGKEEEVKTPDAAAFAKMRRELRELKAKLADKPVEQPRQEPKPEAKQEAKSDPEPDRNQNYQAWLEWDLRRKETLLTQLMEKTSKLETGLSEIKTKDLTKETINNAYQELGEIEDAYKAEVPDYDDAMNFAKKRYADSLKVINPNLTKPQIEEAIRNEVLRIAADSTQKGLNPAEVLYDIAVERFGYTKEKEQIKEEKPRVDLSAVARNKKKSATPLAGGGQGGSIPLTKEMVANMSMAEFSRLTPSQLAALES